MSTYILSFRTCRAGIQTAELLHVTGNYLLQTITIINIFIGINDTSRQEQIKYVPLGDVSSSREPEKLVPLGVLHGSTTGRYIQILKKVIILDPRGH